MSSSNIRLPPRVPSRPHSAVNVLMGSDVATSNSEDGKFVSSQRYFDGLFPTLIMPFSSHIVLTPFYFIISGRFREDCRASQAVDN